MKTLQQLKFDNSYAGNQFGHYLRRPDGGRDLLVFEVKMKS